MYKFDEYLKNKSKSENEDFVLPKSFEYKLEDTLKNLDKENKNKANVWYINKNLLTTAACFVFVFLAATSIRYGVDSNRSNSIERGLKNQVTEYSESIPEVARHNETSTRDIGNDEATKQEVEKFSLEDRFDDEIIDSNNINKIIVKNIVDGNTYKSVDNKVDIEKIISFINDISKEEIQKQTLGEWDFLIQTNGVEGNHTIIIKNDIINIDNKWYKINSEEVSNFKSMYNDLNYDENNIPYCNY